MILFKKGGTDIVSKTFEAPAQLSVYGLSKTEHTEVDGIVVDSECGDVITFERLIFDEHYDVNCAGIQEEGVLDSAPLLDEDGCELTMSYRNNSMMIEGKGTYRAVYHGDNREDITLIKE